MPSPATLEGIRQALGKLSQSADKSFLEVWNGLPILDQANLRRMLRRPWLEIVEAYGDMSATLGGDVFEAWATELGIDPKLQVASGVNAERAAARMGWALTQPDPLGNLRVLLDELVKQPYRSTVQDSAIDSGAAWARVPTGAETCAFCRLTASRGAVYNSRKTALLGGNGKKYHGDCDCQPILVRDEQDYPAGYNPDELYDQYDAAKSAAGYGPGGKYLMATNKPQQGSNADLSEVLRVMRADSNLPH